MEEGTGEKGDSGNKSDGKEEGKGYKQWTRIGCEEMKEYEGEEEKSIELRNGDEGRRRKEIKTENKENRNKDNMRNSDDIDDKENK